MSATDALDQIATRLAASDADPDDVRRLLNLARATVAAYDDLLLAYPDPADYSTERVTLARLGTAIAHLTGGGS